jgi:hypothetical protein
MSRSPLPQRERERVCINIPFPCYAYILSGEIFVDVQGGTTTISWLAKPLRKASAVRRSLAYSKSLPWKSSGLGSNRVHWRRAARAPASCSSVSGGWRAVLALDDGLDGTLKEFEGSAGLRHFSNLVRFSMSLDDDRNCVATIYQERAETIDADRNVTYFFVKDYQEICRYMRTIGYGSKGKAESVEK